MEVEDAETTPRQLPSRKSKSLEQSSGNTAQIRPDIDVILSLKEDYYKGIMEGYFRKLGEKRSDSNNNDAEKEFANEALELFKNRKVGDERVRFFKAEDRTGKSHIQVDESAALESECTSCMFLIFYMFILKPDQILSPIIYISPLQL